MFLCSAPYLSVVEFIVADVGAAVHGLVPVDQNGEGARRPRLEVGHGSRHVQFLLRCDLETTNKFLKFTPLSINISYVLRNNFSLCFIVST